MRHDAVGQQHDLVDDVPKQRRLLGDDDDRDAILLGVFDRLGQRLVAVRVEVRVGFVEHDQPRIAEEGAGQRDPLLLSARQGRSVGRHHRLVALRHGAIMSCTSARTAAW